MNKTPPKELDKIVDTVLAYRPKDKKAKKVKRSTSRK